MRSISTISPDSSRPRSTRKRGRVSLCTLFVGLLLFPIAVKAASPYALPSGGCIGALGSASEPLKVSPGDAWTLTAQTGEIYRLAGLVPDNDESKTPPFSGEYRFIPLGPADRYGRVPALAIGPEDDLLQFRLLAVGAARFRPEMLPCMEEIADLVSRLTGKNTPPSIDATDLKALYGAQGSYRTVEGRVIDAQIVGGRLYVNFGSDWRRDFSATVPPDMLKSWLRSSETIPSWLKAPEDLISRKVRVYGWLESYNGPLIVLESPFSLDLLEIEQTETP